MSYRKCTYLAFVKSWTGQGLSSSLRDETRPGWEIKPGSRSQVEPRVRGEGEEVASVRESGREGKRTCISSGSAEDRKVLGGEPSLEAEGVPGAFRYR